MKKQLALDREVISYYYIQVLSYTSYQSYKSAKEVIVLENLTEMLKGVLEGCVLEIISRDKTYGYEITRKLNALGFSLENEKSPLSRSRGFR